MLANACEHTRPDDRGCDNEGLCEGYLGLLKSANRPRPEYRWFDNKGRLPTRGVVTVEAGDSGADVGIVRA